MERGEREIQTCGPGLLEDQSDVFVMLTEAGLGFEVGMDHARAFGLHHMGGGHAGGEDLKCEFGIESETLRKGEAFGEDSSIQPEDKVDDELHAGARSPGTDVEGLLDELPDQGSGPLESSFGTAGHEEGITDAEIVAGAEDRGVEVFDFTIGEADSDVLCVLGTTCGRVEDQCGGGGVVEEGIEESGDMLAGGEAEDHLIRPSEDLGGGFGGVSPLFAEPEPAIGIEVESADWTAGPDETFSHCGAEESDSDQSDLGGLL